MTPDSIRKFLSQEYRSRANACLQVELRDFVGTYRADGLVERIGSQRLLKLWRLIRYAYGFTIASPRPRRAAPSAGARYPAELLFYCRDINNQPVVFFFDFKSRQFVYPLGSLSNIASIFDTTPISDDEIGIVVTCCLWRSVQRYGERGYFYAIIDCACVISNLLEIGYDTNVEITSYQLNKLKDCIPPILRCGGYKLPVLGILVVNCSGQGREIGTPSVLQHAQIDGTSFEYLSESLPRFSGQLARSELLHQIAVDQSRATTFPNAVSSRHVRDPVAWALQRRSLTNQCSNKLTERTVQSFLDTCGAYLLQNTSCGLEHTFIADVDIAGDNRDRFIDEVFPNQPWLHQTNMVVLLGFYSDMLEGDRLLGALFDACMLYGFVTSDLVRHQFEIGFRGSVIGGFDVNSASIRCADTSFNPVVAFAIGHDLSNDTKIDSAVFGS